MPFKTDKADQIRIAALQICGQSKQTLAKLATMLGDERDAVLKEVKARYGDDAYDKVLKVEECLNTLSDLLK